MPELKRVRNKEDGVEYSTADVIDDIHEVLEDQQAVDGHGRALPPVYPEAKSTKKAAAADDKKGS